MHERVDLRQLFRIMRRRWLTFCVSLLCVFALTACAVLFLLKPTYESTVYILIGKSKSEEYYGDMQDINMLLASTMDMIRSQIVLNSVRHELNIDSDKFEDNISVQRNPNSQIINIIVRDSDPQFVGLLAKTIADTSVIKMNETLNVTEVRVLEDSEMGAKEVGSNYLNLAIAFIVSTFLALFLAMLREYWDDAIKEDREIEEVVGLPILGVIDFKGKQRQSEQVNIVIQDKLIQDKLIQDNLVHDKLMADKQLNHL